MADYDPFFPVFSPHHTGTSRGAGYQKPSADPNKWSLYEAVAFNRLDVVQRILSGRHDLQEIAGALRLAAQRGYLEVGRYLLSRTRVQIDVHCPDGFTPLILAARQGHNDVLQMLLDHGAAPSRCIYRTRVSALHWAAVNGHVSCVDTLLKAGATLNALTLQRRTPLILAACYGHTSVVTRLLREEKNVKNISNVDANGMSALHMAVMEGHVSCTNFLLDEGADFDAQNKLGYTPLLLSIERHHPEIALTLIRSGANMELTLKSALCRAIHLAIALERQEICGFLIDAGCTLLEPCELIQSCCGSALLHGNVTVVHIASTGRDVKTLSLIFDKLNEQNNLCDGGLFCEPTSDGFSPLMLAATYGSVAVLAELLQGCAKTCNSSKESLERFLSEVSLAVTCAALRCRQDSLLCLLQMTGSNLSKPRLLSGFNPFNGDNNNKSGLSTEMLNEICPDGQLTEIICNILIAAGNCDEILKALPVLLPDDSKTLDRIANRFSYPPRLEHLCIVAIRQSVGAFFVAKQTLDNLSLPPSLLMSITIGAIIVS